MRPIGDVGCLLVIVGQKAQTVQSRCASDNVGNRIERPNFVEMHLARRDTMHPRLGRGKPTEHCLREVRDGPR